jgi:hypothetical protein
MRRLFIDIETSPNLVMSWRVGYKIKIDYSNIIRERQIICICWKFENEKTIKFLTWDKDQDDKKMVEMIVPVLDQADEIVGQNIERFDIRWIRTRAVFHHIVTNSHWKIVDTLKFARRNMYFNSNRLDYLGKYFGVGGKIKTEFDLWKDIVLKNDRKKLKRMVTYCKRDVTLLENVYHRLADHMPAHTHVGVLNDNGKWTCAKCGSAEVHCSKTKVSALGILKRQMVCKKCGHYYTISNKTYENFSEIRKREMELARKANK